MKSFWIQLCIILMSCGGVCADDKAQDVSQLSVAFNPNEASALNRFMPKVNVITGEYCEEDCDLIVAGCEPISYRRFYGNQGYKEQAHGHWRVNPECFMLFNFECIKEHKNVVGRFAGIGEVDGGFFLFQRDLKGKLVIDQSKVKGFTNSSLVSGQFHPFNTSISFEKHVESKRRGQGDQWSYTGIVEDGSGRTRTFSTLKKHYPTNLGYDGISLRLRQPFQAIIEEEKRPNGNIIKYQYDNYYDGLRQAPPEKENWILRSITVYNSTQTKILGFMNVSYIRSSRKGDVRIKRIHIEGSDKRTAVHVHNIREFRGKDKRSTLHDVILEKVFSPGKPEQAYGYRFVKDTNYYNTNFMDTAVHEGCPLTTHYDLHSKKVLSQHAPVGPKGEMCPIVRYEYKSDHTIVHDAENNKVVYRFNADERIVAVEKYQGSTLYSVEKSDWDAHTGNLLRKTLEDSEGHVWYEVCYKYDKNHNVIEESVAGASSIYRSYSDDGRNLKLWESDRAGKETKFTYVPETNLLLSEITYHNGKICLRKFYFYDAEINTVCIKAIIDDGSDTDPHNCENVTYRRIVETDPKRSFPCLGLAQEVREKTLDAHGQEMLLSKVVYDYHPSGQIAREDRYDANNIYRYSLINEYDENERLIKTIDASGLENVFAYDARFNLTSQRGPHLYREWAYDAANRQIECKAGLSEQEHCLSKKKSYDRCGRVTSVTHENGFQTVYTYDSLGRIIRITYPDGASEQREYDVLGNITKEIDPRGYETRKQYCSRGQLTDVYYPDNSEEHFSYNPEGTVATYIDRNGTKSLFFYDIFDHQIRQDVYSGDGELLRSKSTIWTPFRKIAETDWMGATTYYSYDAAGRKTGESIGSKSIEYFYDSLGNLHETHANDAIYCEERNFLGQLVEKRIEDAERKILQVEKYTYDGRGNQTHVVSAMGCTETQYNALGQPLFKKDSLGNVTRFKYLYDNGLTVEEISPKGVKIFRKHDSRDNLVKVVRRGSKGIIQESALRYDPSCNCIEESHTVFDGTEIIGVTTNSWVYGAANRIECFIESGQKKTQYLFDAKGRLITKIKPDQVQLHRAYDALGRLSHYYSEDFDYHYTYDANDRVIEVLDSFSSNRTSKSYDILGVLLTERLSHGLSIKNTYDSHGQRLSLLLPDNSQVQYRYEASFLKSVTRKNLTHTYLKRDLDGHVTLFELSGGLGGVAVERDPRGHISEISSPYYLALLAYDAAGLPTEYFYRDALGETKNFYTYDELDQLSDEGEHVYHHDSLYNRRQKDGFKSTINEFNQIVSDGKNSYTYDLNGNLVQDGRFCYAYDTQDRLIRVSGSDVDISFAYDPFHRRISKTSGSERTLYLWDGDHEIGSTDNFLHIQELRILGEGIGAEIGAAVLIELQDESYVPLHDHRGSVISLLNINGRVKEVYRYSAFGEELTGNTLSPWRFSAKRFDEETGFLFFGRRYYNPDLGRWVTPDPQGLYDGPNLYAYVSNHPLASVDLYGLEGVSFSWGSGGNFAIGVGKACYSFGNSTYQSVASLGEWIVADMQYEYDDEPEYFHEKSRKAASEWSDAYSILTENPLGVFSDIFIPGIKKAYNLPVATPTAVRWQSYGEASFDVLSLLCPVGTVGQMSKLSRTSSAVAKTVNIAKGIPALANKTKGLPSLESLSKAGKAMDRGGLTRAGRALDKHGNRPGSVFPKATGNPTNKNLQGQFQLDGILNHPQLVIKQHSLPRYGELIDIKTPNMGGVRYSQNGEFIGFIE